MNDWKTTVGGITAALGTSLMGIGVLSQFSNAPEGAKAILWYVALVGFILSATGKAFLGVSATDSNKPSSGGGAATTLLLLCLATVMATGCAFVGVTSSAPNGQSSHVKAMVPAWPWQDSYQVVNKAQAVSKTNATTVGISGVSTQETTSTNFNALLQSVTAGAVQGAAEVLKAAAK